MFIGFIVTFDLYLLFVILISISYMDLTLTKKIISEQSEDPESLIPKFMSNYFPLETLQQAYMITLIATLSLAVVFFLSVTGLIQFQIPFMFGAQSKKARQNACQRQVLLENLVDTPTAVKLKKLEDMHFDSSLNVSKDS